MKTKKKREYVDKQTRIFFLKKKHIDGKKTNGRTSMEGGYYNELDFYSQIARFEEQRTNRGDSAFDGLAKPVVPDPKFRIDLEHGPVLIDKDLARTTEGKPRTWVVLLCAFCALSLFIVIVLIFFPENVSSEVKALPKREISQGSLSLFAVDEETEDADVPTCMADVPDDELFVAFSTEVAQAELLRRRGMRQSFALI